MFKNIKQLSEFSLLNERFVLKNPSSSGAVEAGGAEKAPGHKDVEKMRALQKAVLTFNILKMNSLQHYLLNK